MSWKKYIVAEPKLSGGVAFYPVIYRPVMESNAYDVVYEYRHNRPDAEDLADMLNKEEGNSYE